MIEERLTIRELRGSSRRRRKEGAIHGILIAAAATSLVVSVGIVVALIGKAVTFLSSVELGRLWTEGWRPRSGQFDVATACALLRDGVGEYRPGGDIVDRVWSRRTLERRLAAKVTSLDDRRQGVRRESGGAAD